MTNAQYSLQVAGGGIAQISTQSTAVPLATSATECQVVQIMSWSTNTGAIVVANSTARAALATRVGLPIWAGSTNPPLTVWATDVAKVYIDGISTEGVSFVYYRLMMP